MIDYLIVGLGNPGKEYENTWHNAGFMAVDALAEKLGVEKFRLEKKFQCELVQSDNLLLIKPQTFMNNSGESVRALADYYKIPADHIFIIHDDIALPLGQIRLSLARGAGGHNGVASIIDRLGTNQFIRFRIGIETQTNLDLEQYVLSRIQKNNLDELQRSIETTVQAVQETIQNGPERAMNQYNTTPEN